MPTALPRFRCTATKTEQIQGVPTIRRCTRCDGPEEHADGYHQWMRPGHRVRWLLSVPDALLAGYVQGYWRGNEHGLQGDSLEPGADVWAQATQDLS